MTATGQSTIRCAIVRGGTSKGLFFHEDDLPAPGPRRDALLLRLMGSPDTLQIDGLGGSRPVTSKVAIISPSARDDADVEYTFAQVDIDRALVLWEGNCGNISAGVGPFAVDEGLVTAEEPVTRVRIHNTNTGALLVAEVPVSDGQAVVEGDFGIPGVPGTGAEIVMDWAGTVGATTGRLLPTGNAVDHITLESGQVVEVTVCDAGNPAAWVRADAVGLTGSELAEEIDGNAELLATARELRGKTAQLLGYTPDWRRAEEDSPGLPLIGFVSPAADYATSRGTTAGGGEMDLRVRLLFMNVLHPTIAGTASIALTAAARVRGSVAAAVCSPAMAATTFRIGHPAGVMTTRVAVADTGGPEPSFLRLGISRTARRIMTGTAYYPASALD